MCFQLVIIYVNINAFSLNKTFYTKMQSVYYNTRQHTLRRNHTKGANVTLTNTFASTHTFSAGDYLFKNQCIQFK